MGSDSNFREKWGQTRFLEAEATITVRIESDLIFVAYLVGLLLWEFAYLLAKLKSIPEGEGLGCHFGNSQVGPQPLPAAAPRNPWHGREI